MRKWLRPGLENQTLQKTFFTSVLTIARQIQKKNRREKSWQDESLIFLKIYPQQHKEWQKNSLYIYWEYQTIYSNSYSKLDNTHLMHLFVDKMDKIVSKIAFQLVIFLYLKKHLVKIVHWSHYVIAIKSSNCWEN